MGKNKSHKVPEERNRDRIEKLAAENRRLRKEVQQLRKELSKMVSKDDDFKELLEEFQAEVKEQEISDTSTRCRSCGSKRVSIIKKLRDDLDYYFCEECEARGPIK
jgi:hypothetical protein